MKLLAVLLICGIGLEIQGLKYCSPGFTAVKKPEGWKCMRDCRSKWDERKRKSKIYFNMDNFIEEGQVKLLLPKKNSQQLSRKHETCLSKGEVYWHGNKRSSHHGCFKLLSQGPCDEREWLVIRSSRIRGRMEIICEQRPCKCDLTNPLMCQVPAKDHSCYNGCIESLAAAQRGICQPGEQVK